MSWAKIRLSLNDLVAQIEGHPLVALVDRFSAFLFLFGLLGAVWYINYADFVDLPPQSVHQWRQADCASMASLYYLAGHA